MNDGPILDPQIVAEVARLSTAELLIEHDALSSPDRGVVLDNTSTRLRRKIVMDEVGRRLQHAVLLDTIDAEHVAPTATTTIEHAKMYLRAHMGEGEDCPVCGRFTRMYRRNISGHMAQGLLAQYRAAGTRVVDTRGVWPASSTGGPNVSLLRFWHLIEPGAEPRTWRVTDLGVRWIMGEVTVQKYAFLFDNRCFGLDGEQLAFSEALGIPFDLDALMREQPYRGPSDPAPRLFDD